MCEERLPDAQAPILDHHDAGNASIQRSADTSCMHGRYLYTHPNQILVSSRLPALHVPVAALLLGIIAFVAGVNQTFYREASTCHIVTRFVF